MDEIERFCNETLVYLYIHVFLGYRSDVGQELKVGIFLFQIPADVVHEVGFQKGSEFGR